MASGSRVDGAGDTGGRLTAAALGALHEAVHVRDLVLILGLSLVACGNDGGAGDTGGASSTGQGTGGGATSTGTSEPTGTTGTTGMTGMTGVASTGDVPTTGEPDPDMTTGEDTTTNTTGAPVDAWQGFLDDREDWLRALAVPISACVAMNDTEHPVFDGCIDWHSAVHATYALHAVYRHTGDMVYLEAAEAKLTQVGLAAELLRIQQGLLPQEIPYGYAWFLALARERELATGATDLRPLATEIRDQLREWVDSRTPAQLEAGALADDYASLTWAALNLWQWAEWTDDVELAGAMESLAVNALQAPALDASCPFSQEEINTDDFFPPCLHRARLLIELLPADAKATWLAGWLPDMPVLTPIDMPLKAHISGLNFSRAWGLWSLYEATDDVAYRDIFLDHMITHLEHPQYWAEDYGKYAHWVAQFGVYAISQTYPE